jgi:hypothetical protein
MRGTTCRWVIGLAVAVAVTAPVAGSAHAGDAFDAGDVVIVDPRDRSLPINEGDSNTIITFRLPDDARCGGDSLSDGWRIHSFLVPEGTDLSSLQYDNIRPIGGEFNLVMRTAAGSLFVHEFTDTKGADGLAWPGEIPPLTFQFWDPQIFPPGRYHAGIACAPESAVVERYWDTTIIVTEDTSVEQWERRWEVDTEFAADAPFRFPTRAALLAVGGVAALVAVWITVQGRRAARAVESTDDVNDAPDANGEADGDGPSDRAATGETSPTSDGDDRHHQGAHP